MVVVPCMVVVPDSSAFHLFNVWELLPPANTLALGLFGAVGFESRRTTSPLLVHVADTSVTVYIRSDIRCGHTNKPRARGREETFG